MILYINIKAYEEAKYVICEYITESKVTAGSRAYINYRNFTLEVSFWREQSCVGKNGSKRYSYNEVNFIRRVWYKCFTRSVNKIINIYKLYWIVNKNRWYHGY